MYVRKVSGGVEILTPAKLNLFLEVLARRDDGFHEIETLMVPISLFDSLTFRHAASTCREDSVLTCREDSASRLELRCQWASGLPKQAEPEGSRRSPDDLDPTVEWEKLPEGNDNVALRAVELLRQRSGIRAGATLQLTKRIPSAAGLGGGSSDAAAALIAANLAWGLDWPIDRLAELAGEIGSDVPFFLGGSPALCQGRGERSQPMPGCRALDFVVVCPPAGLSTAAVYKHCRPAAVPRSAGPLIDALRSGDRRQLAAAMHNALEEPAAQLSPWIGKLRREFAKQDCIAAQMSGSGTSYFGICRHAGHARRVASRLRGQGFNRVFAVRSC